MCHHHSADAKPTPHRRGAYSGYLPMNSAEHAATTAGQQQQPASSTAAAPPAGIPADWVAPWAAGTLFFSKVTPRSWRHVHSQGASVGNGFLASVVDSADVFMGGVFNAIDSRGWCTDPSEACYLSAIPQTRNADCWYRRCNESARARIPALVSALDLDDAGPRPDDAFALDTARAAYFARRTREVAAPGPAGGSCTAAVERRTFAHRTRPGLLVTVSAALPA